MKQICMLSPYISIVYLISVFYHGQTIITLLTPITWIICIVGLAIIFYKRFVQKRVLSSYIFKKITHIDSDIPLILFKLFILFILLHIRTPITHNGVIVAGIILTVYVWLVDIETVYELHGKS